jgi:polyisoprenoid-binding protein YceI
VPACPVPAPARVIDDDPARSSVSVSIDMASVDTARVSRCTRSDFGVDFGLVDGAKVVVGDQIDIQLEVAVFLTS